MGIPRLEPIPKGQLGLISSRWLDWVYRTSTLLPSILRTRPSSRRTQRVFLAWDSLLIGTADVWRRWPDIDLGLQVSFGLICPRIRIPAGVRCCIATCFQKPRTLILAFLNDSKTSLCAGSSKPIQVMARERRLCVPWDRRPQRPRSSRPW